MGKKIKKKTRNPHKEKRVSFNTHEITTPKRSNPPAVIGDNGVLEIKERKVCAHVEKGVVDLSKISSKISSLEAVKCEDCRESALDRRESKGRSNKHGKRKGVVQGVARVESKSVWICLECGHLACGGIGLPTTAQSHSLRHSRQSHHPCVIQFDNPQLRWCFPCNSLIPVGKSEESGEQKDVFSDVVKLIKGQASEGAPMDVEDVWFGNGNDGDVTRITTGESQILDRTGFWAVRGLVNLGNTCFFNSVLQNILAVEQLRDYFLKLDHSVGSLTMALKKLFVETSLESDSRNEINPRNLFGCISTKAPQFRGYQQQDSHELLRYLLDGLSTEELSARKLHNSFGEDGSGSNSCRTFVDAIFGGKLSSTVCCVECGHSSIVYEPFLDLSLPVPTKKPPPKKAKSVSRTKKTKPPIKKEVNKGGKNRLKGKSDIIPISAPPSAPALGESDNSICQPPSSELVKEDAVALLDDFSWLDYIGTDAPANDTDNASQNYDTSVIQGSESKDNNTLDSVASWSRASSPNRKPEPNLVASPEDSYVEELPMQVQDSEVLLLPYKEESVTAEVMTMEEGTSSSVAGCGQDTIDFDGFGDLFNEPEVASASNNSESWPSDKNTPRSSDSDPDEVDDSEAPVSINSCLVYFTKPELLSNEHAWHCENCSKILQDQPMRNVKNQPKTQQRAEINGAESSSRITSLDLESVSTDSRNVVNGMDNGSRNDAEFNTLDEEMKSEFLEGMSNCKPYVHNRENDIQSDYISQELSPSMDHPISSNQATTFDDQVDDSCGEKEADTIVSNDYQLHKKEVKSKSVKAMRDATKRILINSAPEILTIHLKRFSQDARGRLSKLSGHVGFGDTLDLRPYMDPRSNETTSYNYRLVGVVEHSGSMRGGHYIAYVRGGRCRGGSDGSNWFYASDSYVRQVSLAEVLRCEAYILFYERV